MGEARGSHPLIRARPGQARRTHLGVHAAQGAAQLGVGRHLQPLVQLQAVGHRARLRGSVGGRVRVGGRVCAQSEVPASEARRSAWHAWPRAPAAHASRGPHLEGVGVVLAQLGGQAANGDLQAGRASGRRAGGSARRPMQDARGKHMHAVHGRRAGVPRCPPRPAPSSCQACLVALAQALARLDARRVEHVAPDGLHVAAGGKVGLGGLEVRALGLACGTAQQSALGFDGQLRSASSCTFAIPPPTTLPGPATPRQPSK